MMMMMMMMVMMIIVIKQINLEKGPVNQVNSLVPEAHGLDLVLQRLNKQAKDYK